MAEPLFRPRAGGILAKVAPAPFVMMIVVLAIGYLRLPLLWVMAVMVPASILLTWWRR
jgi:hypothetical protein